MLTVGRYLADRARGPPIALNGTHQKRIDRRLNDRCRTMLPKTIALVFEPLCLRGELIVIQHEGFAIARAARAIFDRGADGRRDGVK